MLIENFRACPNFCFLQLDRGPSVGTAPFPPPVGLPWRNGQVTSTGETADDVIPPFLMKYTKYAESGRKEGDNRGACGTLVLSAAQCDELVFLCKGGDGFYRFRSANFRHVQLSLPLLVFRVRFSSIRLDALVTSLGAVVHQMEAVRSGCFQIF